MTIQEFVINCIERARGDDLYRAKMAFRDMTPKQMQEQYGESRRTRQEVLDGHHDHYDKCDAAIALCRERL